MQNNSSSDLRKKVLYIALSTLLVLAIALTTAFILSRVADTDNSQPNEELTLTQRLAELYKSSGDVDQGITLDTATVQASGTPSYNNAHARIIGIDDDKNFAHFYQTPDETWHFFIATPDQDKLKCDVYNTDDLVNAFVGFTCQGAKGKAFVQKDQPEFEVVPGSSGG